MPWFDKLTMSGKLKDPEVLTPFPAKAGLPAPAGQVPASAGTTNREPGSRLRGYDGFPGMTGFIVGRTTTLKSYALRPVFDGGH